MIFDDPEKEIDEFIALQFGALEPEGDNFEINLSEPVTQAQLDDPNLIADLSLGIVFRPVQTSSFRQL